MQMTERYTTKWFTTKLAVPCWRPAPCGQSWWERRRGSWPWWGSGGSASWRRSAQERKGFSLIKLCVSRKQNLDASLKSEPKSTVFDEKSQLLKLINRKIGGNKSHMEDVWWIRDLKAWGLKFHSIPGSCLQYCIWQCSGSMTFWCGSGSADQIL